MMMKKIFIFFCISTKIYSMTAVARLGKPDYSYTAVVNQNAPKGGELRLATTGTFDGLNNLSIIGIPLQYMSLTYETLMYRSTSEPLSLYALIAEKIEIAPDNSSVKFHINPKARFHNGEPVTTADIKATMNTLINKGLPRYKKLSKKVNEVIIRSDHIIEFKISPLNDGGTKQYDPELPFVLGLMPVFNKKQLETIDFANSGLTPLIGTGPYKVKEVDQGRKIIFEKCDNYWGKDLELTKGQYNFKFISIEFFKNANALFQGFFAKLFDIYFETNPQQWLHNYENKISKNQNLSQVSIAHQRPVLVRTIIMNARRSTFQNIELRRALTLAFDPKGMNKLFFGDEIGTPHSLFQNTELAHSEIPTIKEKEIIDKYKDQINPELYERIITSSFQSYIASSPEEHRHNIEKASEILNKAGYFMKNGKRFFPNGKPLVLQIMIKDEKLEKVALSFRENLKPLGIKLKIHKVDANQYENNVLDFKFDMIIHQWANGMSPGAEQSYFFDSKNAYLKGSSNYIGLQDPVAEGLASELNKAKSRDELVIATHALDRYIMHLCYNIPLSFDNKLRIAYWNDLVAFPELNAKHDMNIMTRGWSKNTPH